MSKVKTPALRKPRVLVTSTDLESLLGILDRSTKRSKGEELLEEELGRAVVVDDLRKVFCRLGSVVTYEDIATGQPRTVQIVLPGEADIDQAKISVFTPVGAALMGLTVDAMFEWTDVSGRPHRLKVVAVENELASSPVAA